MRDFKKYDVWKLGMSLSKEVYSISSQFPKEETYNLKSQVRRCAISIPSNIAEGCSRSSDKAFKQFIEIAIGSAFELETQLLLSIHFKYIEDNQDIFLKINHLQASLNSLRNKLKANG